VSTARQASCTQRGRESPAPAAPVPRGGPRCPICAGSRRCARGPRARRDDPGAAGILHAAIQDRERHQQSSCSARRPEQASAPLQAPAPAAALTR
jgi:hypothetical protein